MKNNNWTYLALGIGITSLIIGILRIVIWEFKFMDSIELFIIGLAVIALSLSNRTVNKNK